MATLTKGITYGASETITNTKLHNLVDLGSVSNIINADIDSAANIADTKLAQITTLYKVSGSAIGNLASIPAGAGTMNTFNLPVINSSMISYTSIPNSSLQPLTLTSWVDGSSMRNIQSMPSLAGQLAWYSISSSLASGGSPVFNGVDKFVGGTSSSFSLVTTVSVSGAATTGNITINNTKNYKVIFSFRDVAAQTLNIRFNGDSSASYQYTFDGRTTGGALTGGATGATSIVTSTAIADANPIRGEFNIFPQQGTDWIHVLGSMVYLDNAGSLFSRVSFGGNWDANTTATSFSIISSGGDVFTGTVLLYEIGG